ncbi:PPE family protein [Mycobacterium montefiorense]|uniref:PPE domain-containing protein n=1 Tax=Mycobacterium montefiorense TaxID=154654 RepID=UPI000D59CE0C
MPPEVIATQLTTGAGPAPMYAASVAFGNSLSAYQNFISETTTNAERLTSSWSGAAIAPMQSRITDYLAAAQHHCAALADAGARTLQQAQIYNTALMSIVELPQIAANRTALAIAQSTNVFGQNSAELARLHAEYVQYTVQNNAAMSTYRAATEVNAQFSSLASVPPLAKASASCLGDRLGDPGPTQGPDVFSERVHPDPGPPDDHRRSSGPSGGFPSMSSIPPIGGLRSMTTGGIPNHSALSSSNALAGGSAGRPDSAPGAKPSLVRSERITSRNGISGASKKTGAFRYPVGWHSSGARAGAGALPGSTAGSRSPAATTRTSLLPTPSMNSFMGSPNGAAANRTGINSTPIPSSPSSGRSRRRRGMPT